MRAGQTIERRAAWPYRWAAVVLPLLLVALSVAAVRPDWHHAFHESAAVTASDEQTAPVKQHTPSEQGCAIALLASGAVECAHGGLVFALPSLAGFFLPGCPGRVVLPGLFSLTPPERGPPVFLLS